MQRLLRRQMSSAHDAEAACVAAVRHLAREGLLVSAYLRQGERLRCRASSGYWQIYDGMPTGAGVIGLSVRTGARQLVRGVGASSEYLAAAARIVDELCVPLRVRGAVIGVLNVESTGPLTGAQEHDTDATAGLLQARLEALPLPTESSGQRLGRHAAHLAGLSGTADVDELQAAVLAAARDLSDMGSALLVLDGPTGLRPVAADGPLGPALLTLPPSTAEAIVQWVHQGTTTYTVGQGRGQGFPGHEQLRERGVGSMVCLPLATGTVRLGALVVCSPVVTAVWPEDVELLEALAAAVTSCLQTCDGVRALRQRADRDALTGLGHHAAFHSALGRARTSGVAWRLAVLYVDVDHFKSVNDTRGHAAGDALLLAISACMGEALRERDRLFRIGGDEFAVMAEVSSSEQATALGERLLQQVREHTGATLSVGVAVEESHEGNGELLARADAALYAAKASGRGCVRLCSGQPGTGQRATGQRATGQRG